MSDDTTPVEPLEDAPVRLTLQLDPQLLVRRVFACCASVIVALWLADYHVNYARMVDVAPIRRLFNATREDGLASFVMVTLTLAAAGSLWLIVSTVQGLGASRRRTASWTLLALFFSYMAVDDAAMLHERAGSAFRILSDRAAAGGGGAGGILAAFPSYPWQLMFVPFFAGAGLFMAVFLWRELGDRKGRLLVVTSLLMLAFCLGLDFVEGLGEDHPWNVPALLAQRFEGLEAMTQARFRMSAYESLRHFSKSTEECLEMLAMSLLLVTFLRRWMSLAAEWGLRFAPAPEPDLQGASVKT